MIVKSPTAPAECVVSIIEKRVGESMYVALRTVECEFEEGVLTLRGIVPSFYIRAVLISLAEDLIEREDVIAINDEIDVVNPQGLSSVRRSA